MKAYYPSYFLLSVKGQMQTRQVQGSYDDSYLGESQSASVLGTSRSTLKVACVRCCLPGYSVAAGEFSGDEEEGEGRIYSTGSQCAWLGPEVADPLHTPVNYSCVNLSLCAR